MSEAFIASWSGRAEVDGFNQLVLAAGLTWREVAVLRAYAYYLRQIGTPYTERYVEQVLSNYPAITADLAALFAVQFDPDLFTGDPEQRPAESSRIAASDHPRAGRGDQPGRRPDPAHPAVGDQPRRRAPTSTGPTSRATGAISCPFKLEPGKIPGVPKPVPAHEIWVYSPRLEGVHMRFGDVARGGLRWSDRPEDFRTEILGLVKAQEVKNAVIVPVGAKGGFVVKRPPTATGDAQVDRERQQAEGVACYRMFIAGLLDLTDNRQVGAIIPPERVVRRDDDDSYLVVAADKGTATFSDIANGVAHDYGFWLDDAFASGGSVGYDHKAMGITARGAWESVKHHFRELGVDTQTQDFTCVGVGDMSGDVFGNGMLLSQHIELVAAFDHRHVFVDPTPDIGESFVERLRLFELPRSSWADYDTDLISQGGGVFPRTAKSVAITPQMRAGARPGRGCRDADADRTDPGDPAGAGGPAVERRHRHLHQGLDRAEPGGGGQGQRRGPGGRGRPAGQGRRRGRQPRRHPARPDRVRPRRRPDQHGRHRQLRRGGHLRPRGQHQDRPAVPDGARRPRRTRPPGTARRR